MNSTQTTQILRSTEYNENPEKLDKVLVALVCGCFVLSTFFGASVERIYAAYRSQAAAQAEAEAHPPAAYWFITHMDTTLARDYCHKRHLSWSRIESGPDGRTMQVVCEADMATRELPR